MTPAIHQTVRFRATPHVLFEMYIDSGKHTQSTGAPARINRKTGGRFKAFAGQLEGRNLLVVPDQQVVQYWRASHWKKDDWSILIMTFSKVAGGCEVDVVHVGVPAYDHKGVREGWPKYYWHPWKKFLAK
jgi:activator of HSP90 ATPase